MKNSNLSTLHFEHLNWENELSFYKGQIKLYTDRVEELTEKNTKEGIRAELEQFSNQFKIQNEVIDTLMHNIKKHESVLAESAEENVVKAMHTHFDDHAKMHSEMAKFHAIYSDLKKNFLRFCQEWM